MVVGSTKDLKPANLSCISRTIFFYRSEVGVI